MNIKSPPITSTLMVLVSSIIVMTGCHSHVELRSPEPAAAALERMSAYRSLRPRGQMDTIHLQNGVAVAQTTDYMILGDGSRVHYAEDLLPVVAEDSPTARAAQRSAEATDTATNWAWGYLGVMAGGLALSTVGIAQGFDSDSGVPLMITGLTVATVGGTVALLVASVYGRKSSDERASAFSTYGEDLREKLRLCSDGIKIVDCNSRPQEAQAEAEFRLGTSALQQ